MLKWSSLMMGEISFDKLVFDSPSLSLIKASSKSKVAEWNWREFMAAVNTILPAEDPAQMKKSLRISADEFKIVSGSLLVSDPASQLEEEFKNFSIELFDIANFDKVGEVNGLRGQYGINLGALHFTLPGSSKKIAFKQATVKGSLDNSGPHALGAKINFELDLNSFFGDYLNNNFNKLDDILKELEKINLITKPNDPNNILKYSRELVIVIF
jgi:hypothetical protein